MTRIKELEAELKATHKDYMKEIVALVRQNGDLKEKIGVFMGGSASRGEEDEPNVQIIISSSTTLTRIPTTAMMTMLMKLEQISWSLQPKNISSRPPQQ